ncbi:hypothetical protein ACFSQ0_05290 [Mesonia sediminis]|uniref:Holin n=1 Tax=Mesonia sediminis TaxID=1703946 RepID=A0ABW5SDZ8_9FLAO
MTVKDRYKSKTPKFFRKLRNIGLGITAVAGALLTAPVSLPALVVTIAGYGLAAGAAISAVSQVVTGKEVEDEPKPQENED